MPLSEPQYRALRDINEAGAMTFQAGIYYAGTLPLRTSVAKALIKYGYVALDGERNAKEPRYPSAARVLHYKLTGKEIDEDESEDDA